MGQKVSNVTGVSKKIWILTLFFLLSSCSPVKNEKENVIAQNTPIETKKTAMNLFFPKQDGSGLNPVKVEVEDVQKNSTLWFQELVNQLSNSRNNGGLVVFTEKVDVYSVFVEKNTMHIDFSANIQKSFSSNIASAQLAMDALLASIKVNFPQVQFVKILAEHEDTETVFGHIYAMQPFVL